MAGPLIWKPTTREDVRKVEPREPYIEGWRKLDQNGFEGYLSVYARTAFARETGEPVAIVGLMIVFPGVAEAWICMDERVRPYIRPFIRGVRELKDYAFDQLGLWRVQAPIQATFAEGHRFARAAGLEQEARLRSYFHPQLDAIVFSEVRP